MVRKLYKQLVLVSLVSLSIQSPGRSVDIIINQNERKISVTDSRHTVIDTTRYDYISPCELKIYVINTKDTQCVFVAPCVTEYDTPNDEYCTIYLWPNRVICPDDCVCRMEDEANGCHKLVDDAGLRMDISFVDNKIDFFIAPQVDLLSLAKHYSQSLMAEVDGQKREGTLQSALFWVNTYETIIHNSLTFYLFSYKHLQSTEIMNLSACLRRIE